MRAHASIVGPIDTGKGPLWIGISFAETGEAVAHFPAPDPAAASRGLDQQLVTGQFREITCDPELSDFAADYGWRPAQPPEAASEGKAMFAVAMYHGQGNMSLSPLAWREVLLVAAALWESRPWDTWGERPFAIQVDGESSPRIAVLMGTLGENFGISIYEGVAAYNRFIEAGGRGDHRAMASVPQLWLAFGPEPGWAAGAVRAFVSLPGCPTIGSIHRSKADLPTPQQVGVLIAVARLLLRMGADSRDVEGHYNLPGSDIAINVSTTATEAPTPGQSKSETASADHHPGYGLDAKEIERLNAFLVDGARPDGTMWIDQVHGLHTAVVTGPRFIPPSEWLQVILPDDPRFPSDVDANEILDLLMRFYNGIIQELEHEAEFVPAVFEGDPGEPPGEREWCAAYLHGVAMHGELWIDDPNEQMRALLTPIIALGVEASTPEIKADLADPKRLEEFRRIIPACAQGLYRYWLQRREPPQASATYGQGKTGRNDPCPCGSGKKYKKCCGKKH